MQSRKRVATPSRRGAKRIFEERDAVEVICRLCPLKTGEISCATVIDDENVKIGAPVGLLQKNGQIPQESIFKFAHVFDSNDGQRAVFERTSVDLIENLFRGRNSLLFTYGVTGSGKTYTMTGNPSERDIGVLPRTIDVIFNSISNLAEKCIFYPDGRNGFGIRAEFEAAIARTKHISSRSSIEVEERYVERKRVRGASDDMIYAIFVSYIEVYNDVCYDLLDDYAVYRDDNRVPSGKDLKLGANNMIYVDGLAEVEVESSDEALEHFFRGQERRRVADTLLNKQSSRSHSVFNIRMVMAPCNGDSLYPDLDTNKVTVSQFSLVDLAGSERTKRTGNEGSRLVETGKINQSLLVLRQCFEKLRENQRSCGAHVPVPFRESKITHLFKNYFEGSGKIRMIVCVNPRSADFFENLQVMSFTELAQVVEVAKGTEISFPAGSGFPISRRDYAKWSSEIEKALENVVVPVYRSSPIPPIELIDPSDCNSIAQLRNYFQTEYRKRINFKEEYDTRINEFSDLLKQALCHLDVNTGQAKKVENELEEAENEIQTLRAQLRQSKREANSLNRRIKRYEAEEFSKAINAEEQRRMEKSYQEQLRKKEKTLHQVREIFEKPSTSQRRPLTNSNE